MDNKFYIHSGKGFGLPLPNGYTVSVQFGPGNYCNNYDRDIGRDEIDSGKKGSFTAEVAVLNSAGNLIDLPIEDGRDFSDTVSGYCDPAKVLLLIQWAVSLPPETKD